MKCLVCKKEIEYKKGETYDNLWFNYCGPGYKVQILCPNMECLPGTILKEEEPRPDRFLLKHGKFKGTLISDIVDNDYLHWLHENSTNDLLLQACIEQVY